MKYRTRPQIIQHDLVTYRVVFFLLTFTAVISGEPGAALAPAEDALAVGVAAAGAAERQVARQRHEARDLLRIAVVVVKGNEPVARLHELSHFLLDGRLLAGRVDFTEGEAINPTATDAQ